jgi:TolB protein
MRILPALALAAALAAGCGGGSSSTPADPCALATAGAAWLAFTSNQAGNYDVWMIRADGSCRTPVTTDPGSDFLPAWLSQELIGLSSTRTAGVGAYQHALADGAEAKVAVTGATAITSPAWSPDGLTLAFEGRHAGATCSDIWVAPAAGGAATALTACTGTAKNSGPVWSPDGATLYFVSNRAGGVTQVYSMAAADGSGQAPVTSGASSVLGRPAISPDGLVLAFSRLNGSNPAIFRRVLSTGAEVAITAAADADSDPAFDPSGARLAVSRVHGGANPAIWLLDAADGANAIQVSAPTGGVVDGQPAFRPE